jgi:hypothetical protein
MRPAPARPSGLAAVLTVGVALGTCAVAAAVMAPIGLGDATAWFIAGVGFGLLASSFAGLWMIERRRQAHGRRR